MPPFNPRKEALAFCIWRHCTEYEWNLTTKEIATALELPHNLVTSTVIRRGWYSRLRSLQTQHSRAPELSFHFPHSQENYYVPTLRED